MSNFLIGAGILALTAVFSTGGWLIGSILFIIFAIATWFSLDLLLDAASSTNAFSYEGVAFSVGGWALQMVCVMFTAIWSSLFLHSKHQAQLIIVPQFVKVIIIIDSYGFLAAYMNVAGELHSSILSNSILSNNLSRIRFNAALMILFQAWLSLRKGTAQHHLGWSSSGHCRRKLCSLDCLCHYRLDHASLFLERYVFTWFHIVFILAAVDIHVWLPGDSFHYCLKAVMFDLKPMVTFVPSRFTTSRIMVQLHQDILLQRAVAPNFSTTYRRSCLRTVASKVRNSLIFFDRLQCVALIWYQHNMNLGTFQACFLFSAVLCTKM